jgi:predicted nucleotidyltransferase
MASAMTQQSDIEKKLAEALSGEPAVATCYLFGSSLSPTFGPESDVDVALLYFSDLAPRALDVFDLKHRLSLALRRDVDIVVLNMASPVISMQVLRKGKKLVERDPRLTERFFVRTVNMYADLKRVRLPIERQILNGRIFSK